VEQSSRPLEGLKVVELSIAIAAPSCGRMLSFFGAEVLKIESRLNPDVARLFGSAWARTPDHAEVFTDTSPYLPEMNAGKYSVGLDLKSPAAVEAARKLIARADVFLTNYSTPAVRDLGLDEASLRAINPGLVYAALPAFGSDPALPYYPFISWGPNQAPLVGLDAVTGYPDQEPAGVAGFAPPDYFAGLHAFVAILTAIEARDRNGEGCWIDLSQFNTTVAALGPYLLDEQLSGTVLQRNGNRAPWSAPQGVYPCRGEDRWVAVSVPDDAAWQRLATLLDDDGGSLAGDDGLATVEGRSARHDELDDVLATWTARRSADQAATELQAVGVAAHQVNDSEEMLFDAQLREYGWYRTLPSFRFPEGDLFSDCAMRLSDTPGDWGWAFPTMAEHTVECLTTMAGMSEAEVEALIAEGGAFVATRPEQKLRRPYTHVLRLLATEGAAR